MRKTALMLLAALVVLAPVYVPAEGPDALQLEAMESGKYLLVDFGLDRCVSCIRMRKLLEGIADEISPTVTTKILNINKEAELSMKYQVMLIPAQIIISPEGKLVYEHTGLLKEIKLREALKKVGAI